MKGGSEFRSQENSFPGMRAAAWQELAAGHADVAYTRAEAILEISPDDPESTEIGAIALAQMGRLAEALSRLEALTGRLTSERDLEGGARARLHAHRANVLALMGRADEAIAAYELVLEQDPKHRFALLNLASLELEGGAWPAAARHLQSLLELDPANGAAHYTMGRLLQRAGEREDAATSYRRAVELDPANANAWNNLGNVYKDQNRFEDAARCYEAALRIDPERPALRHLTAALRGETPERADPEYVRDLFDRYAACFEGDLVEKLAYRVPEALVEMLVAHLRFPPYLPGLDGERDRTELRQALEQPVPRQKFEAALDLGCGTGLLGRQLRPLCHQLHGVDLSVRMLEEAAKTGLYDNLSAGEILEFLDESRGFDLIAATDVLIYLGDLDPLFRAMKKCIHPAGWVALSTEHLTSGTYQIRTSGRFAHSRPYLLDTAQKHGFVTMDVRDVLCRREQGEMIAGDLYLFARSSGTAAERRD